MGAGLFWWLGGGGAAVILLLTLTGLLAGLAAQKGLAMNLLDYLLVCLAALAAGDSLRVLLLLARGTASLPVLLSVALPEVGCSLVFAIPVYLLYRWVYRRVGGTALA
jgi:hypothetical protein